MNFSLSVKKSWQAQAVWSGVVGLALFALSFSVARLIFLSYEKLAVLAMACFVSALASRYRPAIPRTRFKFSTKDIFSFWGVLWLGVSGGLILTALSSLASVMRSGEKKVDRLYVIAVDVVSIYAGSTIFYLALGYLPYTQGSLVANDFGLSLTVFNAAALMVATVYLVNCCLKYLIFRLDGDVKINSLLMEQLAFPAVGSLVSFLITTVFYLIFVSFGTMVGVVLAPIVLLGELAYRIYRKTLEQKTREISDASRIHLATVEALATAIDARDQVGIGHVRRTQIYAIGVGGVLGLSEGEINALRTGALLHDIGKLAVPDHILNKPGQLTAAEMEKTKIHAAVGASILENVGFDYPVVPTVRHHHESWDGTGYPDGLRGSEIPLTARILSVADAYDTLRGARPYRPAVARDEACNLLISGAGGKFDPRIVSIFLKNLHFFEHQINEQGLAYSQESKDLQSSIDADQSTENFYVEQIKKANREVFALYEVARDFGSSGNLHETLELFTRRIASFVPFETCSVFLLEDGRESALSAHSAGKAGAAFKGRRIRPGEGPTGEAITSRTSVLNADPKADFPESLHEAVVDYVSMASVPLITDDKLIGAVSLYSADLLRPYDDDDIRLLETISKMAAEAILKLQRHQITETYALTDPMTGLANARSLQMQFEREIGRSQRNDSGFQLLMLDLDGFKLVNDTFGHKAGDKMLQEISHVILGQLRDYDFLSRYAGDEFVALIPDTQVRDVAELCGRIERAVGDFKLRLGPDETATVGVSIGAASYPADGLTFDEVIVNADKAMYRRKSVRRSMPTEPKTEATTHDEPYMVELDETHIISSVSN